MRGSTNWNEGKNSEVCVRASACVSACVCLRPLVALILRRQIAGVAEDFRAVRVTPFFLDFGNGLDGASTPRDSTTESAPMDHHDVFFFPSRATLRFRSIPHSATCAKGKGVLCTWCL